MKEKILLIVLILCYFLPGQAQVSKTVDISAGGLSAALTSSEKNNVTDLTVTGTVDARDFKTMREEIGKLANIDLGGATIVAYSGTGGTNPYGSSIDYGADTIPQYAFWNEIDLTSVIFPEGATCIEQYAFNNCTKLETIVLPATLTAIEGYAFTACTSLASVYANGEVPAALSAIWVFPYPMNSGCTLYVPNGSEDDYATEWSPYFSSSNIKSADVTCSGTQNLSGITIDAGQSLVVESGELTVNESATIYNCTIGAGAAVTINSGSTLTVSGDFTIKSSASGPGSLINNGTLSISGTAYVEQYLTGNKWHIVSPTAVGGSISEFIQDTTSNGIPYFEDGGTTYYGMEDYDAKNNEWNEYFTPSVSGSFGACEGYIVRRKNDGVITFSGSLSSGGQSISLVKQNGPGWNCIGNPYPSAIGINNGDNSFLTANASNLDASYGAIYLWVEGESYTEESNQYKVICNASFSFGTGRTLTDNCVAPGQGFMVKAAKNSSVVDFTADMQIHQSSLALKSAKTPWPAIRLDLSSGGDTANTVIAFDNSMTNGLDPTYDAGTMDNSPALEICSKLVENDNGVGFAVQCLPEDYGTLVVPLEVYSEDGGEISISAETAGLSTTCSVILEDKTTGSFTQLSDGTSYEANVTAGESETGRFYLHTSSKTTGTSGLSEDTSGLKTYLSGGEIVIEGKVGGTATAVLYSIAGKEISKSNLQEGTWNSIPAQGLLPGIYLLNVIDGTGRHPSKIVIN